jgi:hypothetical protein
MDHQWIALVAGLPAKNVAVRMRTWRTLRASGAAVLREGVYLLPDIRTFRHGFDALAGDVVAAGGTAWVMEVEPPKAVDFLALFDRTENYLALSQQLTQAQATLSLRPAVERQKLVRKLRKNLATIIATDFFQDNAKVQVEQQLEALEWVCARALSAEEPRATASELVAFLLARLPGPYLGHP